MYNFTNPSGLVAQALRDAGFERTIGICDGANTGQGAIADWLGVEPNRVRAEVFGLNHLSWCRQAWLDGVEHMQPALSDETFLRRYQSLFDPALVRQVGAYCMEYLYYYYYAEQAVAAIKAGGQTRGEEIVELNQRLLEQLEEVGVERNPERALRTFFGYEKRRGATYMHYAYGGQSSEAANRQQVFDAEIPASAGEGYAGVALSVMDALVNNRTHYTALNVPNRGAIPGMADDDVVEISCRVDASGVHTLPVSQVSQPQMNLMRTIKLYERLTVAAIQRHSRELAIQALMVHPLVLSYPRACALVEEYLSAHADFVGQWQ
jgi:6-phospho-beta-glucosidase